MPQENDVYWDELGVAWRALPPDDGRVASRLGSSMRWQGALVRAGAWAGYPAGALGLALGGWCLWLGWSAHAWNFLARGGALCAAALVLLAAAHALQTGLRGESRSLREMLELATLRSQRLARAAGLGCAALAVLAAGGLAGYALRARFASAAKVSPIEDLLALAIVGVGLAWIWSSQLRALGKYRHLAHALFAEDGSGGA